MTTREQQYSAQLELSTPGIAAPQFPESPGTGDRATIRNVLSWCSAIVSSAGRRIGSLDRLVWTALFGYADLASGSAYPALTTIATLTGVSLRRVRTAVRSLEAVGLLRPHPRPGRPTVYTLLLPESSPLQPQQTPARVARATSSSSSKNRPERPRQTPARPAHHTPAQAAGTPAREGRGPRHTVPPNVPIEEKKNELFTGTRAHQTPARPADVDPGTPPPAEPATASGCAPAPPAAPAEPASTKYVPASGRALSSRPKGAQGAQAQALALAIAAHFAPPNPGTGYPIAPPHAVTPDPGTDRPQDPGTTAPGTEPDTPPDLPPALAGLLERVAQKNRAKG